MAKLTNLVRGKTDERFSEYLETLYGLSVEKIFGD